MKYILTLCALMIATPAYAGTIVIEQYSKSGSYSNGGVPVPRIDTLNDRDEDATTSTSAESVTINPETEVIRVHCTELHRLSFGSDTTSTIYAECPAGGMIEFGAKDGSLYFRTDS